MSKLIDVICQESLKEHIAEHLKNKEIIVGTKKPLDEYYEDVPKEDVRSIKLLPYDPNNLIDIRPQGSGKTRNQMRVIPDLDFLGWKQLIFNPKGGEYLRANEPIKRVKLLKDDTQIKLPFEQLIPSFALNSIPPDDRGKFDEFSVKLKDVKSTNELYTLGMSRPQAIYILNKIKKSNGRITVDKLRRDLYGTFERIHPGSRDALLKILDHLKDQSFFDDSKADFYVHEAWSKKKIPIINSYETDHELNGFMGGKIIKKGWSQWIKGKKMVWFSDGHIFAPSEVKIEDSVFIRQFLRGLTTGRSSKWEFGLDTQFPENLHPKILKGFKPGWKIIGSIDVSTLTEGFIPKSFRNIIDSLDYFPENDLREALLIHPDCKRYWRFFPLGAKLGHPSNLWKTPREAAE